MYSVGSFFSTVSKFYNEINPATLSGAIDIVVVQQANGDLACSPFHVRFGKLSVLRPQEKVVEVRVNGQVIAFPMKVGDAGEAFFVLETDDYVPDEFATSPIAGPSDETDLQPVDYFDLNGQQQQQQEDALLDNGYVSAASGHGSAFEESLKDDSDRESLFSATSPSGRNDSAMGSMLQGMPGAFQSHAFQEPESPVPTPSPSSNIPATTTTDGHKDTNITKDSEAGFVNKVFPSVVREELNNQPSVASEGRSSRRKSEVLFDMTGYKSDSGSESSDGDDLPRGILSDSERHHRGLRKRFGRKSNLSKEQRQQLLEDIRQGNFLKPEESLATTQAERQASREVRRKKRAGIPSAWGGSKGRKRANSMPAIGEPDIPFGLALDNKEIRLEVSTEVARVVPEAMPKRTARPSVMSDTEMEYETNAPVATQSKEWTWGWGTLPVKQIDPDEDDEEEKAPSAPEVPVEIETKEFQMGSTKCRVALSLCGGDEFGKDQVASHKSFQTGQLTFEAFARDPAAILADKKLVCYIDGRFYTWQNAVPQLAALLFFHQPLSDSTTQTLKDQKDSATLAPEDRPSTTRFGTISRWFRKAPAGTTSPSVPDLASTTEGGVALGSDDEGIRPINKALRSKSLPSLETGHSEHAHEQVPALSEKPEGVPEIKRYAKTLRLSSEQLRSLGLNKGANTVSFSVTSSYQGTATCVAKIFLWDYDAQVVISDIDGTITKSDALGHIFAMAGRDWTHLGVAKLFTDIRSNGYHILYLTSRAIGQADYTRKYLQKVEQNSYQLPDGPVIMSPDRLFSAFHREVIIRKPEVFKMACLRDVKKLFGDRNPFYAGFGNRITDALSYRSVNVPPSRIFTIDSYGEVKLELLSAFKSSYLALNDLVNEIFPGQRVAPEFNDWNFWKSDLPTVNVQELPIPTNNYAGSSSSLLSSTTSVAKKVVSLTHSSSSSSYNQPTSPTSPTSPAFDSKNKRMSYERTTYAALVSRQENVTSDDDHEHLVNTHVMSEQQNALKEDARKARAGSPSMLSALVPTRLIRAVRSGSMSTTAAPTSPTLHSPEMKGMVGSIPSSPSPRSVASDDIARPVSFSSSPPLDDLQTDEGMTRASRNSVISESVDIAAALAPSSVPKLDLNEALVEVKEGEDEEVAKHRLLYAGEEAYEDDQDAHYGSEDEGEEYQGDYEDDEGEYMEGEEDEDDEFLDDIEETIEEPFL
ncbi:hypothetical protein CPC16_009903 [Podila verticillata]|nr:hypothetical protein BGZ52_007457 [Haplosporangium bisporale]KAF9381322.1 hypothetical protein CPC16_009903 [Podila verticillata]KAI9231886.1 MAG: Lipin/Ned1/Smp2-domain-containing protein [Podila humilis]